jgi:hypothetical protein
MIPLDRKEIDTLKDVKKGWMHKAKKSQDFEISIDIDKQNASDPSSIFTDKSVPAPQTITHLKAASTTIAGASKMKKPKNVSEMERDLRRIQTYLDKMRYRIIF